jgi:hypothetical protein
MVDPNGIDQHAEGAKLDGGKPQVGLMMHDFSHALMAVAEVATFGARKYSPGGWKKVPNAKKRYNDAKLRHYLLSVDEDLDQDSGLLHQAHECWNTLALLEFKLEELKKKKEEKTV